MDCLERGVKQDISTWRNSEMASAGKVTMVCVLQSAAVLAFLGQVALVKAWGYFWSIFRKM